MRPGPARAALLVLPLALLVVAGLLAPLGGLLWRAVAETELGPALPLTLRVLRQWDGQGLPDDRAFEALAADLARLRAAGPPGEAALEGAARRLAADLPSMRDVLPATAERAAQTRTTRATAVLVADPAWGQPESWAALRRAATEASGFRLLAAVGLQQAPSGGLVERPDGPGARARLARGLGAAVLATLACVLLAWPLAAWIAGEPPGRAAWLSALVVLPFLAGEAARVAGWSALLPALLPALAPAGPWAALASLTLGLLPLMVLPLALAMRRAGPRLPRAAAALGLSPGRVLWRVRLPQLAPGLVLGGALVFAQALGAFIGPGVLADGLPWAAGALAAAARAGEWGEAGALAAWLLLPALLLPALACAPLIVARRGPRCGG